MAKPRGRVGWILLARSVGNFLSPYTLFFAQKQRAFSRQTCGVIPVEMKILMRFGEKDLSRSTAKTEINEEFCKVSIQSLKFA